MSVIDIPRVHVIGMGEVGCRLAASLRFAGVETRAVTRTQGWDDAVADENGVLLVSVREEALADVLDRLHGTPPQRLVLVQNGWIRPLLHDLVGLTRGLIWFTSKGEYFQILRPSPFCGPWATALARALAAGGLPSKEVDAAEFDQLDADKMGFNCVVGLPLAVYQTRLGEYLETRTAEARAVFDEAVNVCAAASGCEPDASGWPNFLESARPLDWVKTTYAKALEFRNQAVVALATELGREAPANSDLLRRYAEIRATRDDGH
jgi:ketopantoate reductase